MTSENYKLVDDVYVYFVTYSIVEWLPVFVSEPACKIITDSLNFCFEEKSLCTNSYVIMPTHIHAIVFDKDYDNRRLSNTLADMRKFTGRSLCDFCETNMPKCFRATLRDSTTADRQRRFWQPSRHPVAIENESFWQQKANYLHDNPARKGLVTKASHWRFSSARYFESDGRDLCDVKICPIDWG